jgi:ABC-type transport system involved in multi-copper enzyme maturation permease subunit
MLVLIAVRYLPPNYLAEYVASLVTVAFPFIPLLGLPIGSTSIVDERESGNLQYLLSNPISRQDFFVGKMLGLITATLLVLVLGFGFAAGLSYGAGFGSYGPLSEMVLIAGLLDVTMLGLAMIVSAVCKRKNTALSLGIFIWFLFAVISDLGFFVSIVSLKQGPASTVPIILTDPVQTAVILAVMQLGLMATDGGTSGQAITYVFGSNAFLVLLATLVIWMLVTLGIAYTFFVRQDPV